MLKHFLTVAVLGLFLGLGAIGRADAASVSPMAGLEQQMSKATGDTMTPVNGGWWAVPVVVGGIILYHEHRRHHRHYHYRCYRKCWWHRGHRHCRRYC